MKRHPSSGFLLLVASTALTVFFFAWSLRRPPLDRIFTLQHELRTGERWKLSDRDLDLFREQMKAYPNLAESLLADKDVATGIGIISAHRDGWIETPHVTIIRHSGALRQTVVSLRIETPSAHLPLELRIAGTGWEENVNVETRGGLDVTLPDVAAAELIQMRFQSQALRGKELRADPSALGVQVTFGAAKLAQQRSEFRP